MSPLEELFRLEVEYHRQMREAAEPHAAAAAHTSFALQHGYEGLIRAVGKATSRDVETLRERLALVGDQRDILAARDSVRELLGLSLLGT
jgi:hypothetical protein